MANIVEKCSAVINSGKWVTRALLRSHGITGGWAIALISGWEPGTTVRLWLQKARAARKAYFSALQKITTVKAKCIKTAKVVAKRSSAMLNELSAQKSLGQRLDHLKRTLEGRLVIIDECIQELRDISSRVEEDWDQKIKNAKATARFRVEQLRENAYNWKIGYIPDPDDPVQIAMQLPANIVENMRVDNGKSVKELMTELNSITVCKEPLLVRPDGLFCGHIYYPAVKKNEYDASAHISPDPSCCTDGWRNQIERRRGRSIEEQKQANRIYNQKWAIIQKLYALLGATCYNKPARRCLADI